MDRIFQTDNKSLLIDLHCIDFIREGDLADGVVSIRVPDSKSLPSEDRWVLCLPHYSDEIRGEEHLDDLDPSLVELLHLSHHVDRVDDVSLVGPYCNTFMLLI
jgi:hypothetical protein